jgi:hypothetical protein
LLVFSELPSLPSAGSRLGCFHTSLGHFRHRCARTMCRITSAHTIRHCLSCASLFKRLSIEPFDTYYNRRLEVDTYYLARSGVDIIETGWNMSSGKSTLI